MRIFLTGAGGFSGGTIADALVGAGHDVTALLRKPRPDIAARALIADLTRPAEWESVLEGQDAVVHLAAFNPSRLSRAAGDEAAMQAVNVDATAALARAAARAGVTRFLFASSVRVYGAGTDVPFRESDPLRPDDPYARSKVAAEAALRNAFHGEGRALAILRLPVVYGPHRGGWLGLATRLGRRGWLLPEVLAQAPKSVLNRENLASAIAALSAEGSRAANGTFNLADDGITSLGEIGRLAGRWAGRQRLHTLPGLPAAWWDGVPLLGQALSHARKPCMVDTARFTAQTGWHPPVALADGLVRAFAPPEARQRL